MGWMVEGPAVEIHAQGATAALQVTSTSTVPLGPEDLGGAPARLRLYGVDDDTVARSLATTRAWVRPVVQSPCGTKGRFISYLDSELAAPFRFLIDRAAEITATCVPARRESVSWPVRVSGALRTLAMRVMYKDVTVVRLPDASWLMVAARYRTLASGANQPMAGSSAGDVVAWHAADPGFSRQLTGPYWIVEGDHAIPDQHGSTWLGVPSAVVAGQGADLRVDVYYAFQTDAQDGRSYLEAAVAGDGRPTPVNGASARSGGGVQPVNGVGVKRFRWADLQKQLAQPPLGEERWEAVGALPGTLLGKVRVWAASDLPGLARPFDEAFARVRIVDPAPFACPGAPDLFFAAIHEGGPHAPRGPTEAHGIWHATALPSGAFVCSGAAANAPCTLTPAVEGLDFIVAAGGIRSRSRLAATAPGALYLDPDPARLPNGAGLRVSTGNVDEAPGAGLTWVQGAATDACQSWGSAWVK